MSNFIQNTFNNVNVRAINRDEQVWFVAVDVCKALEINNARQALTRLDDDEKMTVTNNDGRAGQGAQSYNIINESGLYSLVLRSRKKEAKRFKKWVTAEVLPSIRKTGSYSVTITKAQQQQIKEAVNLLSYQTGEHWQSIWRRVYIRFQVPRYQDLLASDFDAVMQFLSEPPTRKLTNQVNIPFDLRTNADYMVRVRNGKIARYNLIYASIATDYGKEYSTLLNN